MQDNLVDFDRNYCHGVLPRLLSCEQILHQATEMGRPTKDTNSLILSKTTSMVCKYLVTTWMRLKSKQGSLVGSRPSPMELHH